MAQAPYFVLGSAVLVIRGTVDSAVIDEKAFNAWWTNEHLPERLAIPGFLRARRYISPGTESISEYLVCYETHSTSTLSSEPYLAALNAPTPDTRKYMPLLSGWHRSACHVLFSSVREEFGHQKGGGLGSSAALIAFEGPIKQDGRSKVQNWIGESAWREVCKYSTTLALHLLEHDDDATGAGIATKCYDATKVSNSFGRGHSENSKQLMLVEFSGPPDAPFGDAESVQKFLIGGLRRLGVKEIDATLYGLIVAMYA